MVFEMKYNSKDVLKNRTAMDSEEEWVLKRINSNEFLRKRQRFLAKSENFELILMKNKTKLKLKFRENEIVVNSDLEWKWIRMDGNGSEQQFRAEFNVLSEKTIEIRVRQLNEFFRLFFSPERRFISLEMSLNAKSDQKKRFLRIESRIHDNNNTNASEEREHRSDLCSKLFSPYIRNIASEQQLCASSERVCDFGATLVARAVIPRLPNECLQCSADHVFGQRKQFQRLRSSAEVLFLVGCDLETNNAGQKLKVGLARLANALKREFQSKGIETRFQAMALLSDAINEWSAEAAEEEDWRGMSESKRRYRYSQFWPKFEPKLNLKRIAFTGNASHSFDFLLQTSQTSGPMSRHILMVECDSGCAEQTSTGGVDFVSARNHFLHSNVFLHVLTSHAFRVRTKKARHVIGIDASRAYLSSSAQSQSAEEVLRPFVRVSRDLCHVLSLETNGSVWRMKALNQSSSRALLAKRIVANHVPNTCLNCDCILSRDHMNSQTQCHLCRRSSADSDQHETDSRAREPTIDVQKQKKNNKDESEEDQHWDWDQEWTEEDDAEEEDGEEPEAEEREE